MEPTNLTFGFLELLGQIILAPFVFFALLYVTIQGGLILLRAVFWTIGAIIFLRKGDGP